MEDYMVRGIYTMAAAAAFGVLGARQIAHWIDQSAWVVRGVSYFLLALTAIGLATVISPAIGLKFAAAAVVIAGIMAWVDISCERSEAIIEEERRRKYFGAPAGEEEGEQEQRARLAPPPRSAQSSVVTAPPPNPTKKEASAAKHAATPGASSQSAELGLCARCQRAVERGVAAVRCPQCQVLHHKACWEKGAGCAVVGCSAEASGE